MELIGLNGKKGSGKDTAGAYFVEAHGFERLSFAAPLKRSAAAALGLPPEEDFFEDMKNDPKARVQLLIFADNSESDDEGLCDVVVNISVREYLQYYGTEAHREVFGKDFWTRIIIDNLQPEGRYVVTDARFENECGAIRDAGGAIINIDRDGVDLADAHASEDDLPRELVDTILYNNGNIEDLHRTIDAYMTLSGSLTKTRIYEVGLNTNKEESC